MASRKSFTVSEAIILAGNNGVARVQCSLSINDLL